MPPLTDPRGTTEFICSETTWGNPRSAGPPALAVLTRFSLVASRLRSAHAGAGGSAPPVLGEEQPALVPGLGKPSPLCSWCGLLKTKRPEPAGSLQVTETWHKYSRCSPKKACPEDADWWRKLCEPEAVVKVYEAAEFSVEGWEVPSYYQRGGKSAVGADWWF